MNNKQNKFQNLVFKDALKPFKAQRQAHTLQQKQAQIKQSQVIDFKKIIGKVDPIKQPNTYTAHKQKPAALPQKQDHFVQKHATEYEAFAQIAYIDLFDESKEIEEYLRKGLSRDLLKKLKQGYWAVFDIWDIHGYQRDQVLLELESVLARAQQHGRCLKIIHGQGYGSKNQNAVLKKLLRLILSEHPKVLAFCNEHQQNSGAILVLLAASRN